MKTYYFIKFGVTYYRLGETETSYTPQQGDLVHLPVDPSQKDISIITLVVGKRHRNKINNNLYCSVELHNSKDKEQGDRHREILCKLVTSTWEPIGHNFPPKN